MALDPDSYLQLDDVVATVRQVPGVGPVTTSGIVTQVRARHEGASFASDVFLISDGVLPAQVQEIAEISTTRVDPECYVPPRPGQAVRRAFGDERDRALYFDQMDGRIPVGLGRDGAPVFVNVEFLDGTRGAHVSISGISGVATKTSFALFLLYSIFHSGVLGERAINAKALVFSVKGEDLLFLDCPNTRLDDDLRARYATVGLDAHPFASVGFFAPPKSDDTAGRPDVVGRTSGVTSFWWTIEGKLADDTTRADWAGPVTGAGTINAFVRRLRSSIRSLRAIIRADLPRPRSSAISTENQQVTVVDLHQLPERAQRFVVGVVLAAETRRKEAAGPGGLLFTMIDELNKYAPREGSSPIKEVLLDIAERGRSLGIILIGAQQTASEVERRIVSNSSIKVVGRLDPAEAGRPEYGLLSASQRQRATLAKPGAMFVSQPEIPLPLAVEFPFPAWATRLSECAGPPPSTVAGGAAPAADPFDRLPDPDDDPPPF